MDRGAWDELFRSGGAAGARPWRQAAATAALVVAFGAMALLGPEREGGRPDRILPPREATTSRPTGSSPPTFEVPADQDEPAGVPTPTEAQATAPGVPPTSALPDAPATTAPPLAASDPPPTVALPSDLGPLPLPLPPLLPPLLPLPLPPTTVTTVTTVTTSTTTVPVGVDDVGRVGGPPPGHRGRQGR